MNRIFIPLATLAAISLAIGCKGGSVATTKEEADSALIKNSVSYVDREKPRKDSANIETIMDNFATKAAIGGMMEVEASALMLKRTENPDIQTLATMMLKDHGAANSQLTALAKKLHISLPAILPTEKTIILGKIETMQEDPQNLYYADLMVREHIDAVALFEQAGRDESGELQKFAVTQLPILKLHLSHARSIQKIIHGISGDKGEQSLKMTKDRQ